MSSAGGDQGKKKPQDNLLDLLGEEIVQPDAGASRAEEPSRAEKGEGERSSRHRDDRDRERGRSDKDRDGRDKDRRRTKEEPSSSSVQADLEGLGDLGGSSGGIPRGYTLLGENAQVRVASRVRTSGSQGNELALKVLLQNKGGEALSGLELSVVDTMNLKCKSTKSGVVPLPSSSASAGQTLDLTIKFEVQDIATSQSLKASLAYSAQGAGDAKLDLKFPFPSSAFIIPSNTSTSTGFSHV